MIPISREPENLLRLLSLQNDAEPLHPAMDESFTFRREHAGVAGAICNSLSAPDAVRLTRTSAAVLCRATAASMRGRTTAPRASRWSAPQRRSRPHA